MDLSLLDEQILAMDDSFLVSKPEAMDDEVSQILKKWNKTNSNLYQSPKKDFHYANSITDQNETFDTRTFTRPKRRSTNNDHTFSISAAATETNNTLEPGVASMNLPMSSLMKRSWLNDVSPPNSICRSMDFQNNDNLMNSLITSGDFTNVSFLLNGNDGNETHDAVSPDVSPTKNLTRNLMDFTFNVYKPPSNATFSAEAEHQPHDNGSDNLDDQNSGKNLTYDAHKNGNLTWGDIQDHHDALNQTIVQSTPVHASGLNRMSDNHFDHTVSPISSLRAGAQDDDGDEEVIIRNLKVRNLVNDISLEDYRNSLEDQCEFLLNEETIKLSSRVCGDTFECLDMKTALIQSADASENEFDIMLDTFDVKKSLESEKLLQSVDNIKQRHSIINFEKQREEKQKKDEEYDNKTQYDAMNKSSERLLRRSRQYDDVNLQLQKQQIDIISSKSAKSNEPEELSDEIVDKSNRDRFKTIKLNKKLQSGMVVVNDEQEQEQQNSANSSPGAIKERTNQINQIKHDNEEVGFKKLAPSKLSKFGFSRPTYRSRNDLNLPLKANSTDSLDNDEPRTQNLGSNAKSPMGIKSKSIHNLMFSMNSGLRAGSYSNLKLAPSATGSQSNIRAPRTSSLVRPSYEGYRAQVSSSANQLTQMRAPTSRKTSLVRPSSGYYGNTYSSKRLDSDNESGNSLSSSSASSRNSVHLSNAIDSKNVIRNDPCPPSQRATGTIPKPSGLRPPSNLRAPQAKSGLLPRPSGLVKR